MIDIENIWKQYDAALLHENLINKDEIDGGEYDYQCKQCGSSLSEDMTYGTLVCIQCGLVNETDILDTSPEWLNCGGCNMDDKKDMARCGVPTNMLLEQSSMSTVIKSTKFHFMKKIHNQLSMNYVERGRYHVFESIYKMASEKGHLPNVVVDQAKYYYKILSERKLSRGVIRKGLIACCIVYACKTVNVPRSLKEISKITDVSVPILNKTMKIFFDIMKDILAKCDNKSSDYIFEATECSDLINRYVHNLKLKDKKTTNQIIKYTIKINDKIKKSGILDCKTPSAIASSIIALAVIKHNIKDVSKNDISKLFNVSVVTINKIMKIIEDVEDVEDVL
tara:strand:- start:23997 stop:25007 length:1011 start_codon:yes stop_codon:yes gene_type:complete